MKCKDVMTISPRCCVTSDTAMEAAEIIEEENVGFLPVIETKTQKLVGTVTDRDLCLKVVAKGKHPREMKVTECMSVELVTCRPEDHIKKAEMLMKEHQIRRIPIVGDKGNCIGIISQADIALKVDRSQEVHAVVRNISKPSMAFPPIFS